ncbi:MAG TPA: M20/M25/M40 family metallo-hydrolase [candidate division Zixibacteria bacterium]|nr:M20/M25/M40 family metallo-hydrolase [candidate division Zixibacteria bacterium]
MINPERLKNLLIELIKIDSLSRKERDIALRLKRELEELGASVLIDDAGDKVGGNVGNVIARIDGTAADAPPLLLSAHMDTVVPGEGVVPILEGDILRTDGRTVLGGDDKSGLAIICEVVRALQENNVPYGDLDIVFTICEEAGLIGAKCLDTRHLRAKTGLVLDSDSVGFLFTKAPAANRLEFHVHGLEAHAGVCPEKGISAIKVAAEGIAAMKLGRIDHETTANIGLIEGGMAVNIVPNSVILRGEARSHSREKLEAQTEHMLRCLQEAAARHTLVTGGTRVAARVEARIERDYDRMEVPDDSAIVRLVRAAAKNLDVEIKTMATGGGCDANILNQKGLEVANLSTGMREIHTVKEWLDLKDLNLSARMVFEIVRLNAADRGEATASGSRAV